MRLHYRAEDNKIEILRCFGSDPKVVLPEEIDGMPVTEVAAYAFSDRCGERKEEYLVYETEGHAFASDGEHLLAGIDVEEVILPNTVQRIGNYIFYGCKNLKRLEFSDALLHIGGGAFTGCGALKLLTVHMKNGDKSCVKEILGELWQRIDVVFQYEHADTKSELVFPEHYEEAVENTPARILYTQHHGSGNNYRQCFYNKEMDYRKYDSLFSVAAAWDKAEVLADIALGRLGYPYELADKDREAYSHLLKERYGEIIKYLVENEKFSEIKIYSENRLWLADTIEYAIELASRLGKMEILSYLMNEKQKYFPNRRKSFEL